MKIFNKKIPYLFFFSFFFLLLFSLAGEVFAVEETVKVQYRFLPFEDQGGTSGGGTTTDDGIATGEVTTPGDSSYTDGSATFHYVYVGDSDSYPGYRAIDCYSVEPSGLRCDVDLGFESDITPMPCDNVWGNQRTNISITPAEDIYVNWGADGCGYNMPYTITGSGQVSLSGSTISSSGTLYCSGGLPANTNCSPADNWETSSCPASYFCPGYGSGVSGDSTYSAGAEQTVAFTKAVVMVPEVTIYANGSSGDITINAGEEAIITWESTNASSCKLTEMENGVVSNEETVELNNRSGKIFKPSITTKYIVYCE